MTPSRSPGPGLAEPPEVLAPETAAHWRAMPPTRLLDCGMDYGDILELWERTRSGVAWDLAAEELADAQISRAEHAVRRGRTATAQGAYHAAIGDLVFAQMAFNFDVDRKRQLYARLSEIAERAADLADPAWEKLSIDLGDGWLRGWLMRPAREPALGTVVVFGGQSGWGLAYRRAAQVLARRGIASILAEGPGQGESRLRGGVLLDVDIASAYSRFVDVALADPRLGGVVGLWGNSLGGLYAATTAARDPRVSACCVNGAPAAPRLLNFRTFAEQAGAMLGTTDPGRIRANFDRIRFEADRDRITCPLLVLHGGCDPIVTVEEQQPFLRDATHPATALRVWADGEHTIYNHATERDAEVADWFADRFVSHRAGGAGR